MDGVCIPVLSEPTSEDIYFFDPGILLQYYSIQFDLILIVQSIDRLIIN